MPWSFSQREVKVPLIFFRWRISYFDVDKEIARSERLLVSFEMKYFITSFRCCSMMGYFLATAFKQRWQLPNRGRLRKWCFVSFVEKIYFFFPVELFSLFGFPKIMLTKGNFISFVRKFIPWENLICGKIQFLLWFSFSSEAQYQLYQSWFLQILYFYEEIVRGEGRRIKPATLLRIDDISNLDQQYCI